MYAWLTVCPNFYHEGKPYSRTKYKLVTALGDVRPNTVVDRFDPEGVDIKDPLIESEDTDEILDRYLYWRKRFNREEYFANRFFAEGEPLPSWSHDKPEASGLSTAIRQWGRELG